MPVGGNMDREQEKIDFIKGYINERIHELKIPLCEEWVQCFICKKWWQRKNAGKQLYHNSLPGKDVVCASHAGVQEWWDQLLAEANAEIKRITGE